MTKTKAARLAAKERRLREQIAELLADEIADTNATHDQIAERAGISRQLLSRIINGRGNPRINGIVRAFAAFDRELFVEPSASYVRIASAKAKAKAK